MKKTRMFTLGLALLVATVLAVPATFAIVQQPQQPAPESPAQTPKTVTIKGTVSNVSEGSVTVLDSNKAEQKIAIDANTKILKAGKAATAADLKANDAIEVVAAKGEGDALTAITIKVG
jgi:cytoskeletal protein RodZ